MAASPATSAQRTLKPNGRLHSVVAPLEVRARTRAYAAYGWPVIQGSATGIATAGDLTQVL